jgi:pseudoazurin
MNSSNPRTVKKNTTMRRLLVAATLLALVLPAGAAEFEVKMLNKGAEGAMVFEPSLLKIAPGGTVKFLATDKTHNAESIAGMIPESAKPFAGKVNEEITVTFEQPGIYGIKCLPHYGMGMVAMIVVGTPVNEAQAKAVTHPGRAKQIFASLFSKLEATQTAAK